MLGKFAMPRNKVIYERKRPLRGFCVEVSGRRRVNFPCLLQTGCVYDDLLVAWCLALWVSENACEVKAVMTNYIPYETTNLIAYPCRKLICYRLL